MKTHRLWQMRLLLLAIAPAFLMAGCSYTEVHRDSGPEPVVYSSVDQEPWAPAGGYRDEVTYYYYPGIAVYEDYSTHDYYWRDHDRWRHGRDLPRDYRSHMNGRVIIHTEGHDPGRYHDQIVRTYPPSYNRPGNNDRDDHRPDNRPPDRSRGPNNGRGPNDDRGPGRDNGPTPGRSGGPARSNGPSNYDSNARR